MIVIYTTCRTKEQAEVIAEKIIKAKAAICVKIWPIEDVYFFNNELKKEEVFIMLIYTQELNLVKMENFLKSNIKYNIPFLLSLNIDRLSKDCKDWSSQFIKII